MKSFEGFLCTSVFLLWCSLFAELKVCKKKFHSTGSETSDTGSAVVRGAPFSMHRGKSVEDYLQST